MKMNIMGIHGKMHQWILDRNNYPENSGWDILFQKSQEEGLPKGSDLSCTLFLIFMNDEDLQGLFADDLAI